MKFGAEREQRLQLVQPDRLLRVGHLGNAERDVGVMFDFQALQRRPGRRSVSIAPAIESCAAVSRLYLLLRDSEVLGKEPVAKLADGAGDLGAPAGFDCEIAFGIDAHGAAMMFAEPMRNHSSSTAIISSAHRCTCLSGRPGISG